MKHASQKKKSECAKVEGGFNGDQSYNSKLQKEEWDGPGNIRSVPAVAENSDIGFKGVMLSLCSKIMLASCLVIF